MPPATTPLRPPRSVEGELGLFGITLAAVLAASYFSLSGWFHLIAYRYRAPVENVWAHFYGPSVETNSLGDYARVIPYHLERATSWDWISRYWNWEIWTAVVLSAAIASSVGFLLWRSFFSAPKTRERDLSSPASSKTLVRRGVKKSEGIFAGRYRDRDFYIPYQDRGLVVGPPRIGKTAFLLNQLLKASENRLSFVAIDIKPELTAVLSADLKQKGYRVLCFDPLSDETDHYNPLDDIRDETAINELVINLLPYGENSRDKPFTDAKRDYLRSALLHLKAEGNASLPLGHDLITRHGKVEDYLRVLGASSSAGAQTIARRLTAGIAADPLVGLGFASAGRDIEYLGYPTLKSAFAYSDFSLSELGQSRPAALFVRFQESRLGTLGAVLSALYGHFLNHLIDHHRQRQAVALFFDEIGNIPRIEGLITKLNTLAGRQLPTWTYWQGTQQMGRLYGHGAEHLFFEAADAQLFFRAQDAHTREMVSTLIGTTHALHRTDTVSPHGPGQSWGVRRVNVIEPHEVGELRDGEVIALYKGESVRGWATPYYRDYPRFRRR